MGSTHSPAAFWKSTTSISHVAKESVSQTSDPGILLSIIPYLLIALYLGKHSSILLFNNRVQNVFILLVYYQYALVK